MTPAALAARLRNCASRLFAAPKLAASLGLSNLYPPREPCIHAPARQSCASGAPVPSLTEPTN